METVERRVRAPPSNAVTLRLPRLDPELLALARGEAVPPEMHEWPEEAAPRAARYPSHLPTLAPGEPSEPVDPFGGLIPVYDEPDAPLPVDDADILEARPAPCEELVDDDLRAELEALAVAIIDARRR